MTPEDVLRLQGLNERVAMGEVAAVYLPLARLLSLYVEAERVLYRARASFLDDSTARVPYVIGLAGSVGVGKSTTARILRELLARGPEYPKVDLVNTDGRDHLGHDQRSEPSREHPADPRARSPGPPQGTKPPGR